GKVDFQSIKYKILLIVIGIAISFVAQWIVGICNNKMTYQVVRRLREETFVKLQRLPVNYIDKHPTGDIVSRIIADIDQIAEGLLIGFSQFFTSLITIIGTLVLMLTINVSVTLIVVLLTPVSFVVASFIAKRTYKLFSEQSKIRSDQTVIVEEIIANPKEVKVFGYEDRAIERFDETNERLRNCSLKGTFFSSITNPATRFVNSLVYAGVGIVGAILAINGGISVGQLTCFLSYANQYTKPFNEISGVFTELQNSLACAGRVVEILEEEEETDLESVGEKADNQSGSVEFENVSFSYDPRKKLIENFSFKAEKGQHIAIVGPTGCGKTTLMNLLMRFYDVDKGDILIDGESIYNSSRQDIRSKFGIVLQETWLVDGTVRDNILYGNPDVSEEDMIAAAKKSHAHSFIKRLPKGYDTIIGETGVKLSEGQRQLLSIARIMVKIPPILILDEATSMIDTRTEMKIQGAFMELMAGRTSFIVAHRLSTIKNADQILVMRDGNVIEQGKHEELIKKNGFYAEIYNSGTKGIIS
ncbi:MAG: ABC transporter ATP-binding protein/permease, partial [Eubacterium sp.]|nr:ABC transporter ATP-binding protein/permease [Eubacterium sp.]